MYNDQIDYAMDGSFVLKLYQSNKLEILLEYLNDSLATGRTNPLIPERIIVQNSGVGQWVAQQLASKIGIFANFSFELPTSFAWDIIRKFIDAPLRADLEKDELVWQIFAQIYSQSQDLEEVQVYLGNKTSADFDNKLFNLSYQLADIYDQYQVYRQDWVLCWDKRNGWDKEGSCGKCEVDSNHWQVRLWQKISQTGSENHRAALMNEFFELFQSGNFSSEQIIKNLPQRISIFGIDTLAPIYLQFFAVLSEYIDVTIYSFNACMEYWGDIASEKQLASRRLRGEASDMVEYIETGNNLLSSMGKVGRAYHELLLNHDIQEFDCFDKFGVEEFEGTFGLLQNVQNDILTLQNGSGNCDVPDGSIQVHDCHTSLRELEVLHDQLLNMFDNDDQLKPSDIVVMTPDINKYAPSIEAVFGSKLSVDNQYGSDLYIPWSIADRTTVVESPVIQALLQLVGISKSRMTASEVIEVLKVPAVTSRFGLTEKDLNNILQWIDASGIRWGLDSHFRKRFGLPETELNSWQFGLERMLLGYALGGDSQICFDRCGYEQIEGSNAETLGRLTQFIYKIGLFIDQFSSKHSALDWQLILNSLVDTFFNEDEESEAVLQQVRSYIDDMVNICEKTPLFEQDVLDIDVIQEYLTQGLTNQVSGGAFIAGKVTFCTLQPMRAIPFKVVCLLGMNDGEFPRQSKRSSLDLIAHNRPRLGDRNRRDDDRYLFLQSLLSARDKLYISYSGRSVIDNSYKMPSTLVCELFDYFERYYSIEQKDLVTIHPLQPFDKEYFGSDSGNSFLQNSRLFSYAKHWLKASDSKDINQQLGIFIDQDLPDPEEEFRTITIDDLLRFFKNPAAFLLKNRLSINLDIPDIQLHDDEPFALGYLENYNISDQLLHGFLHGQERDNLYLQSSLSGDLPYGYLGKKNFNVVADGIEELAEKIKPFIELPLLRVSGEIELQNIHLSGVIDDLFDEGLILYRAGKLRPIDRIELNIKHLFLQLVANFNKPAYFFAVDDELILNPVTDPVAELSKILNFYWQGLYSPFPFFANTSFAYAQTVIEKNDAEKAMEEARKVWNGYMFSGEAQEPYNWVIYKGYFPEHDKFVDTAVDVFDQRLLGEC